MKYYSETLKKFYDTEADLVDAEKAEEEKLAKVESTKKQLAKAVEVADKNVDLAYEQYDKAQQDIVKLKEEYEKKIQEVLKPAVKAVTDATSERAKAIRAFNDKYGVYTTSYTGDKALKEYEKITKRFCDIFNMDYFPFIW